MTKKDNINYSILSIPLAFVGLPIYINVSDFYIRHFELNIAYLAFIILLVRLIDAIQEPILGLFSDFLMRKNISHKIIIYYSSCFLALSFFALFNPPSFLGSIAIMFWLTLSMVFTYSFYNLALINFESLAVVIAKNSAQRISINSYKEFFGLIGILTASATPTILRYILNDDKNSYFYLSLVFILLLFMAIYFFFRKVNDNYHYIRTKFDIKKILATIFAHKIFVKLMIIIFINSLAVSLPASVITFFVNDILKVPNQIGFFLVTYFLSAGIFMNFWRIIANKYGKVNCWYISILGSIITFIFAYFIDASNYQYFYLICFFSGIFLGADLMMPPILISEIINDQSDKISSYISFWSMINKFGLMLASFLSLLVLSLTSFDARAINQDSMLAIPILYAIIPCLLKLSVFILLIKAKNLKNL